MDKAAIHALVQLNNDFYRANCASFSATRSRGWDGWNRVGSWFDLASRPYRICDVACGNLRFERFACERFPDSPFSFTCIDSCSEFARAALGDASWLTRTAEVALRHIDVLERLIEAQPIIDADEQRFDAAVAFGFLHHIPTHDLREAFLRELVSAVRPGGIVAASFWQFAQDGEMRARATETTCAASAQLGCDFPLEKGDYLLGWENKPGAFRYCHSFDALEIDAFEKALKGSCDVAERFEADGRNGRMNAYLVLKRR